VPSAYRICRLTNIL